MYNKAKIKKCVSPIFPYSSVEIGDSQVAGEKEGSSDYRNSDGNKGNWDCFMETFQDKEDTGISKDIFFTKSGYVTFYPGYSHVGMLKYI